MLLYIFKKLVDTQNQRSVWGYSWNPLLKDCLDVYKKKMPTLSRAKLKQMICRERKEEKLTAEAKLFANEALASIP